MSGFGRGGGEDGPMEEGGAVSAASFSQSQNDWDNETYDHMPITLELIQLLQGTFPPAEIEFLKNILKRMQRESTKKKTKKFILNDLNTYVSNLVENPLTPFVVNALNIARTITYLNIKVVSECLPSQFDYVDLNESFGTVCVLAHGDMNTVDGKISPVYPHEDNPKLLSIITETVPGCSAYNYPEVTQMIQVVCFLSPEDIKLASNKTHFRSILESKLSPYKKLLQEKIEHKKKLLKLIVEGEEKENFKMKINELKKDSINIDTILEGKTFATYGRASLKELNTLLENRKIHEKGYANSGIHFIPGELIDSGIFKFTAAYLHKKQSSPDPDAYYYQNIIIQIRDFNPDIQKHIEIFLKLMIGDIKNKDHYGFSIYKMPGAILGSLMFEVVKHYMFKIDNHKMRLLFWVNFELDNLVFNNDDKISDLARHIRTLTSPLSLKYAELATLLEIFKCCGTFNLVLQSCLDSPDPDVLDKLSKHQQLTQPEESELDFRSQSQTQLLPDFLEYNGGGGGNMEGGGRGIKYKRHGKKKTRRKQKPQKTKHKKKQIKKSKKHITKMRKTIKK